MKAAEKYRLDPANIVYNMEYKAKFVLMTFAYSSFNFFVYPM
jgi:hypothetical protein